MNDAGYRIAYWISFLFHPFVIVAPLFYIVSFRYAEHAYEGALWGTLVCVGVAGAPYAFIRRGVKQGRWTDRDISRREQRLAPFLITLGCMLLSMVLLLVLRAPLPLLATFSGMVLAVAAALLVTQLARWKISLHLIGFTGAVLTLALLVTPRAYGLVPLIAVVGWARWRVRAHTPMQAAAGAALAAVVTFAVVGLFGLFKN